MPNIEMYGYRDDEGLAVELQIREALKTSSDPDEIVVTVIASEVRDLKGNRKQPFLRLVATKEEIPELKERLVPLNEDIEIVLLHEWIEHK